MRRRTLLAAVPAAALLPTAGLAGGPKPKTAPAAPKADAAKPPVWEAGADRFVRPDVHGGDRVIGASFASRTAAYGLSGAAGTAHPLATQAGIELLKLGGFGVDAATAHHAGRGLLQPPGNHSRRRALPTHSGPRTL